VDAKYHSYFVDAKYQTTRMCLELEMCRQIFQHNHLHVFDVSDELLQKGLGLQQ
jgi:hypothetical protein